MTFQILSKIMKENNIPEDVELLSDSGWECSETKMDGIYYNRKENKMIFTQDGGYFDNWFDEDGWEMIYGNNKLCQTCIHLIEGVCEVEFYSNFVSIDHNDCCYYEKEDIHG